MSNQRPDPTKIITRPSREAEFEANQDMLAFMQSEKMTKFAKSNYCVMNKSRTTVVKDPGMNKPFYTPFKNRAEQVAKDVGGVVETLHDAFQFILNHLGSKTRKTGGD